VNVDLIVNRQARRLRTPSPLRDVLLGTAASVGARVHETHSLDELERVAEDIAARGTDAVVLAGGDGSHMGGVSALARAFDGVLPPIALAPGGMFCLVAHNFGMHGRARAWAERVVRAAGAPGSCIEQRATLRVRDRGSQGEGNRVGFIFGAGLVSRYFDEYYAGKTRGLGAAVGISARIFAGSLVGSPLARRVLAAAGCTLEVNGELQRVRAWSLVPPRALARQVPRVLTGRAMRGDPRVDALASSLRVAFDGEDTYVLDGDVMRAREVRIEPGPVLRVIVA
jgi:diacylglycerol kinase (ATP)